jgi:hypothetical protein
MNKRAFHALVVASGLAVSACGSNNPARPSMSFIAPLAQQPANGEALNFNQQPIKLTLTNAVRTGNRAVAYVVEVSNTDTFDAIVARVENVAEESGGSTTVTLPALEGNRTYFWRSRGVVDGVEGEPSPTQSFFLRPNIVISQPGPQQPGDGSAVFSPRPTFTVANATTTGPAGTIFYEFQVATSSSFSPVLASATIQQQPGQTSWTPSSDLPEGQLFWRARARDLGNNVDGPFSAIAGFDRRFGIDLDQVVYVQGPNISKWPQTAHLTAAFKSGDMVCTEFDANWPNAPFLGDPSTPIVANQWIFANIGNVWYGGAGHWLRPGQFCKTEYDDAFFVDAFRNPPFNTLVLHPGDVFGVMVSTPARFYPDSKTLDERSDVALLVW